MEITRTGWEAGEGGKAYLAGKALPRLMPPLPIRYKKPHERTYWVNTVDALSEDTFRISMPVDLNPHERILFEIFDGGAQISGMAEVVHIADGSTEATCRILTRRKRNHLPL